MTTIACVLRSGGDFDAEDVRRLAQDVQRHMEAPYRFVCLTDDVTAVAWEASCWKRGERDPLPLGPQLLTSNWPGWWAKLEMFNLTDDMVICFDLDTVIVGSLTPLIEAVRRSNGLCMVRSFLRPKLLQSGILAWQGECRWPLRAFPPAKDNGSCWQFLHRHGHHELRVGNHLFRGDGEWLADAVQKCHQSVTPLQDVVGGLYSYKKDVRDRGLPDDAAVVCFHGRPRPKDVNPKPEWMLGW